MDYARSGIKIKSKIKNGNLRSYAVNGYPKGPLVLFYKCGPSSRAWWGMVTISHDSGRVWSEACRLPEGILGTIKNKPVRLPSGDLICGSSTEHDGWRVHFEITGDEITSGKITGGMCATWMRTDPVDGGGQFQAIQPSILTHPDGRLQILCRSREGRVTTSWSDDNGLTWSAMTATDLPNPNAGTDAVTLADDRHLLVYNHTLRDKGRPRNREMLNVVLSDDGLHWQAALVLENESGEFSCPAVIQASDGLVHITYTWKRLRVRHVVLDPKQLQLQPITNSTWPIGTETQ